MKIHPGGNDTTITSDTFISFQPGNTEKMVLRADGDLEVAKNVEATGNVTGAAGTFTGALGVASLTATGAIAGNSLAATLGVTGATVDATGKITAGDNFETVTGLVLCAGVTSTGALVGSSGLVMDEMTTSATEPNIGTITFNGTGTDDMVASGDFTGTADTTFNVKIDSEGTEEPAVADTFSWGTGSSFTDGAEGVSITGAAQTLQDGIAVTFLTTVGHTDDDEWSFTVTSHKTNLAVDGITAREDATFEKDIVGAATTALLFGPDALDGSWRIVRSGNDLLIQRYVTDAWVTKSTIAAA